MASLPHADDGKDALTKVAETGAEATATADAAETVQDVDVKAEAATVAVKVEVPDTSVMIPDGRSNLYQRSYVRWRWHDCRSGLRSPMVPSRKR